MRLPHARRTQQQDVLFLIEWRRIAFECQSHMLKMVAQRHAQHLLGLCLPDDEPVQMPCNISRLEIETELRLSRCRTFTDARLGGCVELGFLFTRRANPLRHPRCNWT